jgi:hypothetical protein
MLAVIGHSSVRSGAPIGESSPISIGGPGEPGAARPHCGVVVRGNHSSCSASCCQPGLVHPRKVNQLQSCRRSSA